MAIGNGNFKMRFKNTADSTDISFYTKYFAFIFGVKENNMKNKYISQNYSNPFSQSTSNAYSITIKSPNLIISNITGSQIKQVPFSGKQGELTISPSLSSGDYLYSILQEGNIIQTNGAH